MGWDAAVARAEAESLVGWWRDAGVDTLIDETPRRWLESGAAKAISAPLKPVRPELVEGLPAFSMYAEKEEGQVFDKLRPNAAGVSSPLPTTLPELLDWYASGDVPEAGPPTRRLRPGGDAASGLMILTDLPELCDLDAGTLLTGEIAELFDNMLNALGRTRETVYLASLCPGRPPSGRLADAHFEQLADAARAHVRLVAPERLWLMGDAASRALLGMNAAQASGKLRSINLEGVRIAAIATAHPRLLRGKEHKRRAWAEMQRLIAGVGA